MDMIVNDEYTAHSVLFLPSPVVTYSQRKVLKKNTDTSKSTFAISISTRKTK